MILSEARRKAKALCELLQSATTHIEIAGSIRRWKLEVSDIEIVAEPKFAPFNELNMRITSLLSQLVLQKGKPSEGMKNVPLGPRYYRLQYDGIDVDLFCVISPAEWGVIFTLRTGSAEYSRWLVTEALRRGMKVESGQLFKIHRDEEPWRFERIPCETEQDFFNGLGIQYQRPPDREITDPTLVKGVV